MKQTILGKPAQAFQQTLRMRTVVCIALVVLTAAINLVCVLARTETNHTLMLWVNILTDILCGFFVLSFAVSSSFVDKRSPVSSFTFRRASSCSPIFDT